MSEHTPFQLANVAQRLIKAARRAFVETLAIRPRKLDADLLERVTESTRRVVDRHALALLRPTPIVSGSRQYNETVSENRTEEQMSLTIDVMTIINYAELVCQGTTDHQYVEPHEDAASAAREIVEYWEEEGDLLGGEDAERSSTPPPMTSTSSENDASASSSPRSSRCGGAETSRARVRGGRKGGR